jgi:MFS family permease
MSAETTTKIQGEVAEDRLTGYHVWVMIIGVFGYAAVAADSALLPTALPLLTNDLGLDLSKLGYIYAAGFLACGIVSIAVVGRATDRWGRKPVLAVALSITAIFTMLSSFTWDMGSFAVARTLATIGYMTWATASVLIAESVPAKHRGWMVSCIPAGWGVGFGLSALFSGQVATSIGWRPTFLLIGALPLVLALLVVFTIKETPRFLAIKSMDRREVAALRQAKPSIKALFTPQMRRRTIGVSLFSFFAVWVNALTSYYANPYLNSRSVDFVSASQAVTLGNWIAVLATVAAGVFCVIRGSHWALISLSILSGIAALGMVLAGSDLLIPLFIACLVVALALWGAAPNFVQETFPTWVRGTGGSFASGCAWCGYGVCALLVEPIVSAFSWTALTLVIALPFTIIMIIGIVITPRPAGRNAVLTDF